MKNTKHCPKCGSQNIVRVPDNPNRHASGNNIYTSAFTLMSAATAGMWKIGWKPRANATKSSAHSDKKSPPSQQ